MTQGIAAGLYRVAGTCSIISAATTLAIIFLPHFYAPVTEGLVGRIQRVSDPVYGIRAWIHLFHPFLVFVAALGMAAACRHQSPAPAIGGLLGFALWAIVEASQQSLTLFAFDDWRRAWLAGDAQVRATFELRAAIYDGLWEAAYSLLLIGFAVGNAFFAMIFLRLYGLLDRLVGAFMLGATVLTLFLLSAEVGGPALPSALNMWLYPALQPLGRLLIGLWLLRVASRGEPRVKGLHD